MPIVPPYLKTGDTIAIACPAGWMSMEKVRTCVQVLGKWGFRVRIGKTLGSHSKNYFSGTDQERLDDFQELLDDGRVAAILCARGGYGVGRIIEQIDFKKFKKHPKWIIGFSDITVLQAHILSNFRIATLHAPMADAFNDEGYKNKYVKSLRDVLMGKKNSYECRAGKFNRPGKARAELVGGNLSLLAHGVGTSSDIKTKGRILFLEDVGEYQYKIDRMMYQLKRNGKLDDLAGLIVGRFTEIKDTTRPFGEDVYEMIYEIVKDYEYPLCFEFPVGHVPENYALKVGAEYRFRVENNRATLKG